MTPDRPVVCCDLDGVVWRGDEPIRGAGAAISGLRGAGFRVAFVSNNSSQPVGEVAAKLAAAGVPASSDDMITSAVSAATLLAAALDPGSPVLACAGPGVVEALEAAGLRPVTREPAAAVVVGLHRGFDFDELDRAVGCRTRRCQVHCHQPRRDVSGSRRHDPGSERSRPPSPPPPDELRKSPGNPNVRWST